MNFFLLTFFHTKGNERLEIQTVVTNNNHYNKTTDLKEENYE